MTTGSADTYTHTHTRAIICIKWGLFGSSRFKHNVSYFYIQSNGFIWMLLWRLLCPEGQSSERNVWRSICQICRLTEFRISQSVLIRQHRFLESIQYASQWCNNRLRWRFSLSVKLFGRFVIYSLVFSLCSFISSIRVRRHEEVCVKCVCEEAELSKIISTSFSVIILSLLLLWWTLSHADTRSWQ